MNKISNDLRGSKYYQGEIVRFESFTTKKMGLTPQRKKFLRLIASLLSIVIGFSATLAAQTFYVTIKTINSELSIFVLIVSLILLFYIKASKYGLFTIIFATTFSVAIIGATIGASLGAQIGTLIVFIIVAMIAIGAATGAGIYSILGLYSVLLAILGSFLGALFSYSNELLLSQAYIQRNEYIIVSLTIAIALEIISGAVAKKILFSKKELPYSLIFLRERAIAFSSWGGTSFKNSTLIGCNFSGVDISNTDFRNANIIRSDFQGVTGYESSRFGNTIFDNALAKKMCFRGMELQGKLQCPGANLNNMYLRGVNLGNSLLSGVQALGTDFTGAIFSGACIEDWSINSETLLDDITCNRISTSKDGLEFKGWKPDSGEFKDGQFSQWITTIRDVTIDLILEKDIGFRTIAPAILKSGMNNPNSLVSLASIENKETYVVIKLKVSLASNKEQLHRSLMMAIGEFSRAIKNNENISIEIPGDDELLALLATADSFPFVRPYGKSIRFSSENQAVIQYIAETMVFQDSIIQNISDNAKGYLTKMEGGTSYIGENYINGE